MTYIHQFVAPDSLQPNPWNSNRLTPDAEQKLDVSIQRFGFVKPLIVRTLADGSKQILGGEHRWHSAQRLSITEVPVVNLGGLSDERAKEIGLIDNARYGMDDAGLLAEVLKTLGDNDDLASFLPYTTRELDAIFATSKVDLKDLSIDGEEDEVRIEDEIPEMSVTHQIMRFKVPVADAEWVSTFLEHIMKLQGFKGSDSLTNAGDGLVFALKLAHKDLSSEEEEELDDLEDFEDEDDE